MIYKARPNRTLLFILLILTIPTLFQFEFPDGILFFSIFVCMFNILVILIQFKLRIEEKYFSYQIVLLTFPIYEKVVYPNQIIQMNFKRYGWMTKGVLIRTLKGFNIRIVGFEPKDHVIEELLQFAIENDISISKSKDYLLLE